MKFSSKSRAACFYCISPDLLICIIFYAGQITCRCWCRQSADAQHAKSNSGASNLHRTGASNLTDNKIYGELKRLEKCSGDNEELLYTIQLIAETMNELKGESE